MIDTNLSQIQLLIKSSQVLLVDKDSIGDCVRAYVIETRVSQRDVSNIKTWIMKYSSQDLQKLEEEGITRAILQEINTTAKKLQEHVFLPFDNENSPMSILSSIFYQNNIDIIKEIKEKLEMIYEIYDNDLKYQLHVISRDLVGKNNPNDIINLLNPYYLLNIVVRLINDNIIQYNSVNENVPMSSFIFSSEFKLLSTFRDDIRNKGLNDEEIKKLNYYWSHLMVNGFALNQVKIKLDNQYIIELKKKPYLKGKNNDYVQLYSEFYYLREYYKKIIDFSMDIDDNDLNQIYQNHLNDDSTPVLKSFIEKLIPSYKFLNSPQGLLKLTFQMTNDYQEFVNGTKQISCLYQDKGICPLYFDYIPHKLVDCPYESYEQMISIIYISYYRNTVDGNPFTDGIIIPTDLEEIKDLSTLTNQKYYIASYLMNYMVEKKNDCIKFGDAMILLSLLKFKIDVDCQEARDLENYFDNTVKLNLKKYEYDNSRFNGFSHFAKYIINTVNKAEKPLDPEEMKEKLSQCFNDGIQDKSISKCCYLI